MGPDPTTAVLATGNGDRHPSSDLFPEGLRQAGRLTPAMPPGKAVHAHKRAQAEGGEVMLVVTATTVLRILAITGIDRMIPNFSSLDEALN